MVRTLALASLLVSLGGGLAHARKQAKQHLKVSDDIELEDASDDADADDADDADAAPVAKKHKGAAKTKQHAVAVAEDADDDAAADDDESPLAPAETQPRDRVVKHAIHARSVADQQDWHFAIGPNMWIASVDANVSVGGSNVASGIDFASLSKNVKFGLPLVAEARYGRIAVTGDMLYGAVGIAANKNVGGSIMANVTGEAASLQLDTFAGYLITGGDEQLFSIEARAGLRYQRTAVTAMATAAGATVQPPQIVMGGKDALAGTRVFLRPWKKVFFDAAADVGVFGSSSSTWSAGADINLRPIKHVMVTAGYKTMTIEGGIGTVEHGPRLALQLLF